MLCYVLYTSCFWMLTETLLSAIPSKASALLMYVCMYVHVCICNARLYACIRDVPGTNFLPGTEYRVLRRFFTGSGYRVPGI